MTSWDNFSLTETIKQAWKFFTDSVDSDNTLQVKIRDSNNSIVDSFGEPIYPSGSSGSETITLTNASTAYQAPTTLPTNKYILILYNNSANDIYWSYDNTTSNGIKIPPDGKVVMNLAGNNSVYVYSLNTGDSVVVNWKVV